MGRLWGVCNTPLHRDIKTRHIFHLPPHSLPKTQPVFRVTRQNIPRLRSFFAVRVGAYCIRPTEWPRRGQECASTIDHLDHSPHKWVVCGAYSIRPYTGIRKRTTFSTSHSIASPKGSLFFQVTRQNIPRPRSFFGRHGRGVWHTPHKMAPQGTRMRIGDRSFGSFAP